MAKKNGLTLADHEWMKVIKYAENNPGVGTRKIEEGFKVTVYTFC